MDGISLTIGGAALTTIGGVAGAWIKAWTARHQKTEIAPLPLSVEQTGYQAGQKKNEADHSDLFGRIRILEAEMAGVKATIAAKFDGLSAQMMETREMVRSLYERVCNGKRK